MTASAESRAVQAARGVAERALVEPFAWPAAEGHRRRRWVVIGDPQTTFARLMAVLEARDLLAESGRLRPETGLVCIGDHFDFAPRIEAQTAEQIGYEGTLILAWLASHPPDHSVILLGNHDTCRVQELARETDDSFAQARSFAQRLATETQRPQVQINKLFAARFPNSHIPTAQVTTRDWLSFSEAQRRLLQNLLLAGRLRLAALGKLQDGTPALITHAGFTVDDQHALGAPERSPSSMLATRLNQFLALRVDQVRRSWQSGRPAALDLEPLHRAGQSGREGGGLLYHRPAQPQLPHETTELVPGRRFHPSRLPRNLTQVCGHVTVEKCRTLMPTWTDESLDPAHTTMALLGTVRCNGDQVVLCAGHLESSATDATLLLIDARMNETNPEQYPVLELSSLTVD